MGEGRKGCWCVSFPAPRGSWCLHQSRGSARYSYSPTCAPPPASLFSAYWTFLSPTSSTTQGHLGVRSAGTMLVFVARARVHMPCPFCSMRGGRVTVDGPLVTMQHRPYVLGLYSYIVQGMHVLHLVSLELPPLMTLFFSQSHEGKSAVIRRRPGTGPGTDSTTVSVRKCNYLRALLVKLVRCNLGDRPITSSTFILPPPSKSAVGGADFHVLGVNLPRPCSLSSRSASIY